MFPISIGTTYVPGDMPVVRIDPQGAPFKELAAGRIQLLAHTGMEAHSYEDSELLLTGVDGEVEVGSPGRGAVSIGPGVCVMVTRGELFTLANRTGRPATVLAVFSRGDLVDSLPRPRRTHVAPTPMPTPTSAAERHLQAVA